MDNTDQQTPVPEKKVPDERPKAAAPPLDWEPSLGLGLPVPKQFGRYATLVVVAIVVVIALGFGIYKHFSDHKASPVVSTQSATAKAHTTNQATTIPTRSYTAADFNLSFNYPTDWDIVNNGTGPVTVTSPGMPLTSATGQSVTGKITMTIQAQGQIPASFMAGTALAVLNSQEITYTNPSTTQNMKTYLSFVQYSSTNTKGGLDGIYVTGNDGYQKDQVIPSTDVGAIDPLITITFTQCGNSLCTENLTPLTVASTSWSKTSFQAPVLNMLRSLVIQ
jgi:hypothetical protein